VEFRNQVSVIVPSYNSFATIRRTLSSIFEQKPVLLLKEILVVDSSDDGKTPQILDTLSHEKLRVIHLPVKTSPAAARNLGAQAASGEILAFIDSDAYADRDWLERIVSFYESGCRVGGGVILLPPEQHGHALALVQYFLQFSEFMGGVKRPVRFTPSCNLFCEKKLFNETGGFPGIRAAEDVLFGLRVSERATFYFDPAIRVFHIFSETWKRYRTNQILLGEYTLVYRRLHGRKWIYRWFPAVLLVPIYMGVKFYRVTQRVVASGDAILRRAFFGHLPLFLVGLCFLAFGFGKACFKKTPVIS
jgi:glycosyltransferase involved in cell wall biosynthesis